MKLNIVQSVFLATAMMLLPFCMFKQGVFIMAYEQTALEKFNDIERFFSETKPRDVKIIKDRIEMRFGKFTNGNSQIQSDGSLIRNFELGDEDEGEGYKEEHYRADSPLILHAQYDKNGILESKYITLYGSYVNDMVLYDKKGKMEERYPQNMDFKFSDVQLRQKFLKDYQIDIFDNQKILRLVVHKLGEEQRPCYLVISRVFPSMETRTQVDTYLFDGITGDFLYGLKNVYYAFGDTRPLNTWLEFKKYEKQKMSEIKP